MINLDFLSDILIHGVTVSLISYLCVLILTPRLIRLLITKGEVVRDYHKAEKPRVPRPAGPALAAGIAIAEVILFAFTLDLRVLAILFTSMIAFVIGYIDDKKVMPGWFKPVALIAAGVPLIVLGAHDNYLNLIFGTAFIPLLYIPLILIIIPIVGNTINSIDVLNGAVSGFVIITCIPLLASIAIFGDNTVLMAALPLFFATLAFYKYHRYPSKIFPGDSGTLLLGAVYGSVAIAGNSEIIGVIALLPAVVNSFLFLSSVKKIVEHRQVTSRPTILTPDFRLAASPEQNAPVTLLRLILTAGPLSEAKIVRQIFLLALFSALLSFASIILQYYMQSLH
ncbi:MAG: UDP-N-acetylglucosamine-1-phosphate transferase [Thermoproteota archaeon]|nr:UDP-N-acetylglucosamine-1-phosphate transferase [Thermoproteota archaeon]